ncbi:MAG: hypothetical protein Q4F71_07580 [Paracoccus sp. (in: a-proteobacteria)]|nr:hypothetical protein [Paracoccus sp. (in: a-proteobacteria)]
MTRFTAALAAVTALTSPAFANDACAPGAVMSYPVEDVVLDQGRALRQFDRDYGDPRSEDALNIDTQPEIAELRAAFLADEHHLRRDAILLAGLADYLLTELYPLETLTTVIDPDIAAAMVKALDNRGHGAIADLIRQADALFDGETDLRNRQHSVAYMFGTGGEISPYIEQGKKFLALEDKLIPYRAAILETATDLFMSDDKLGAMIEAEHRAADRGKRLFWALRQVVNCNTDPRFIIPPDLLEAFPQPQRDLLALFPFRQPMSDTNFFYYFDYQTDTSRQRNMPVSESIRAMDRNGLPDHAQALRELSIIFLGENGLFVGEEMDDLYMRYRAVADMDDATEDRIFELSRVFSDAPVWDDMIELAISSGFMPELAEAPE